MVVVIVVKSGSIEIMLLSKTLNSYKKCGANLRKKRCYLFKDLPLTLRKVVATEEKSWRCIKKKKFGATFEKKKKWR